MPKKTFTRSLLTWYLKEKRDLPWRHTSDPYHIWVSEMMLQQTTVSTVIAFYERWIKQFPDIKTLANADIQTVLKAWQGLGYYARARNFHKAANIVLNEYKAKLPQDPLLVRALPGFGPYATAAVLSIAYNVPLPVLDANVRRVVMRLLAIQGEANPKQDVQIMPFLNQTIDKKCPGDFNQAMMELGALICKAKNPACLICPVKAFCKAYEQGIQELIPQTVKKTITPIHASIAIIKKGKQYFIQQRESKGLLKDMWEFPGGKIEKGETKEQALIREIKEEVGVDIIKSRFFCQVSHFYTTFKVTLYVYICDVSPMPKVGKNQRWVSLSDIKKYPMPSGSAKIYHKLIENEK